MQCVVVQVDSTGRGALKVGYEYQTLVNMTRFPVPKSLVQLSQAERARLRVTGPYTGDMGAAMDILQPDKVEASTFEMLDVSVARLQVMP